MNDHIFEREISERPAGYSGPDLSPIGLRLHPTDVGEGAHALLADVPPKDNNGVVYGSDAALVIDAGITGSVAAQIREHAAALTDRPLRYLVNTTYHGDHTFGNADFSDDVCVISSAANRNEMSDLEYEKRVRAGNMHGDEGLFDAVTEWRRPDVVFESYAEIDLGGRTVELHHFGAGNGPGDTIVYVPSARTAWTGNFLCRAGIAHMLLQAGPDRYIASLDAMRRALPDLGPIVPGHGPMGDGHQAILALRGYLERLRDEVHGAVAKGYTLAETMNAVSDPWERGLDDGVIAALAYYDLPRDQLRESMLGLCRNLHRLNILSVYRGYTRTGPRA